MKHGTKENGESMAVVYNRPSSFVSYWQDHLQTHGISISEKQSRFGEDLLVFSDPDGMRVEFIINHERAAVQHWNNGSIPAEYNPRGFHGVTEWVDQIQPTADLLVKQLGCELVRWEGPRARFRGDSDDAGENADLFKRPGIPPGCMGVGSIHHIAFRTADDSE
jgi:glyoxalase family protein